MFSEICQFEYGNLNTSNITALNALYNVTENKVWKNNVTVNNKTKATRGGGDSLFFFIYSLWWIFSNDQMSTKNSDPQYKRMCFEHWKKTSSQFWTIYIFDILVFKIKKIGKKNLILVFKMFRFYTSL